MKYIKGPQNYSLESLETCKCNVVCSGNSEGIWVKQADGEVILQNHSLAFYPFPTWGLVLPSKSHTKDTSNTRERIDVTALRGDSPDKTVLTIHPEAWESYLKEGVIDEEGNFIIPKDAKEEQP